MSKRKELRRLDREEQKQKKHKKDLGYDPLLIEKIQPQGGITFKDERYIECGGGYEACIHIYEFPKKIDTFWLSKLCAQKDTVATVDISTDNVIEVKKNINRSMKEQQYRYAEATDFQERYDAKQRLQEMERLYDEIDSMGEIIKLLHIRIFVSDHSWVVLENKVKTLMVKLEGSGYKTTIYLNEGKREWCSMYKSYKEQEQDLFFSYGQPMVSQALAAGDPFHFSTLEDPTGDFIGHTACGGNVLFDEFTKTNTRLFYNSLIVGTMGSGRAFCTAGC